MINKPWEFFADIFNARNIVFVAMLTVGGLCIFMSASNTTAYLNLTGMAHTIALMTGIAPCVKAGCLGGGIVLDPFMGSGTTAIVAMKLLRKYIGCEINPEYIKIAEQRIAKERGLFDDIP